MRDPEHPTSSPPTPPAQGRGRVHSTAVVDPDARLDPSVSVGPFAVVGPGVVAGAGVRICSHTVLSGLVELDDGARVGPFACIGQAPQDRKYAGCCSGVRIGAHAVVREFVTINRATEERGWTTLGPRALVMAYSHIAHDCRIGSGAVLSNGATLAGHVRIGDDATLGGMVAVHQFVRIGRLAFVAANAHVERDVPPFTLAHGQRARLGGLNLVGLRRDGFDANAIGVLRVVYRALFRHPEPLEDRTLRCRERWGDDERVATLLAFLETSERGICR